MTNTQTLLERLTKAGVKVSLTPERKLLIDAPKDVLTTAQREELKQHKEALLAFLSKRTASPRHEKNELNETSQPQIPGKCSLCQVRFDKDDSPALIVLYCQFCDSTWTAFNDWQAATTLASEMFEASTFDECQAITDALDERAAVFMLENAWNYEQAMRAAEANVLPPLLDDYWRKVRFGRKIYEH